MVQLRLLGPIELVDDGSPVALGSSKERLVLAALGVAANRTVSIDALVEAVWGETPPSTAVRTLQAYISRLRKALATGDTEVLSIGTRPPGYVLRAAPEALDVTSAAVLVDQARDAKSHGDHALASACLSRALGLWRGCALGEFNNEPFARSEVNRLDELRLTLSEERIDAELACGRHSTVVADLEAMCSQHPLRERLWALRMLALYRSGRQAESLRAYEQVRVLLADELGVVPNADLCALERAVLDQSAELDWRREVTTDAGSWPADNRDAKDNLPAPISSFVGRQRELSEVCGLLAEARLVTLAGPGGVGKTRLALEAAAQSVGGPGDGVWFVDLASIAAPALVAASAAKVLGVSGESSRAPTETIVEALGDRALLVVLDNCEQVIDAVAALADAVLRGCRQVTLMATSREPLGIDGEHVYRVPSLSMPSPDDDDPAAIAGCEAVRLFVERARQRQAAFCLDVDTAAIVGRLCRRLDGIPFAIELAAARVTTLSVRDLETRLNKRFQLLTGGSRNALPRHQTLQALIDWSWDLLLPAEQNVLCCLSVFVGGFDLAAAEAVSPGGQIQDLDLLDAVVDKSLVQADHTSGSVRYRLLETVRDYAAAKLAGRGDAEANRVARAHRAHFLALAEAAKPNLRGHGELAWIDRLDLEVDNLRVALTECLSDADPEPGLRIADALCEFWNTRGYGVEGAETLRAQLARPAAQAPTLVRGRALAAAGHLVKDYAADYPTATALAEEALDIAHAHGDDILAVRALYVLATARNLQGDHSDCLTLIDQALPVARRLGDPGPTAQLLNVRGCALDSLGEDARGSYEEAAALFRQAGDRRGIAAAVGNAGFLELNAGDHRAARGPIGEALRVFLELGDRHGQVTFALNAGYIAYLDGDDTTADQLFRESLDIARRIAARPLVACALLGLAATATRAGAPQRAAILHGAFDAVHDQLGGANDAIEARLRSTDHLLLRALIGDESFEVAYQEGRALPLDDALEVATRSA